MFIFTVFFLLCLYILSVSSQDLPEPRLLDSEIAEKNQFPFVVRLYSFVRQGNKVGMSSCTGTIIDHDLILTAAHCIDSSDETYVFHGDPDHSDVVQSKARCVDTEKHFCYKVRERIAHRQYKWHGKKQYDVALLKLEKPMSDFDDHEIFNCSRLGSGGSKNCTLLGWGISEGTVSDNRLHYKTGIDTETCTFKFLLPQHICLIGHHVCKGDSGGPLICNNLIYGVASFATYKAKPGKEVVCEDYKQDYYVPTSLVRNFLMKYGVCKSSRMSIAEFFTIFALFFHLIYFYGVMYGS